MCCQKYWQKIVPFVLAATLSVFIVDLYQKRAAYNNAHESARIARIKGIVLKEEALRITSKSPASYTEAARRNQTMGVVRLKVTFLASGEIGDISVINGLPDGLTEQAIIAAKSLKFEPVDFNGTPITVVKTIEYSFSIY